MHDVAAQIDRIAPTKRPQGRRAGCQRWHNLLFIHWRVPPSAIEPLIPKRLSVDTYKGNAWVGLVAFDMTGVRPWWFPAIPKISAFHETNVRTYVHLDGKDPGVWFFSLDASQSLAVDVARRRWKLPYFRSDMTVQRQGQTVRYTSKRLWPGKHGYSTKICAEIGDFIPALDKSVQPGQSVPGTLEHFLAERYFMYAQSDRGALFRGQVHHAPYPLREATLAECEQTLCEASTIEVPRRPEHVLFSDGVIVDIFPLCRID
jgi:uncharacterized protein YqjF (DUF2071 family)